MDKQVSAGAYERPVIEDFGSLWDHTFATPGTVKLNVPGNLDARGELGS